MPDHARRTNVTAVRSEYDSLAMGGLWCWPVDLEGHLEYESVYGAA